MYNLFVIYMIANKNQFIPVCFLTIKIKNKEKEIVIIDYSIN